MQKKDWLTFWVIGSDPCDCITRQGDWEDRSRDAVICQIECMQYSSKFPWTLESATPLFWSQIFVEKGMRPNWCIWSRSRPLESSHQVMWLWYSNIWDVQWTVTADGQLYHQVDIRWFALDLWSPAQPPCTRKSTSFNLWSAEILQKLQSWERRSWSGDSNLKHCSAVKKWWFMKCGGCKLNPDTGWQASEGKAKQRWEKFQVVPELQSHWFRGMSDIYFGKGNLQTRDADFGTWRSKSSCVEYTWVLSASITAYWHTAVYLYTVFLYH